MIPISTVQFGADEEKLVLQVLRSGAIAQGPMVARFESEFASRFGVKHAIAVNNGTTALVAALQVLDLEPGDEVITTPYTFVATLNAILEAGATAVFADIRDDDFNIDPEAVAEKISDRTRVLMPVHLYGQMADMDPLIALSESHALRVIEDAAQSHGAEYHGRPVGNIDLATYSFYATKNITTGEGGMITTNDDTTADRLRILRNQGMRERYVYEMAGHNYRLTDLQAAVAIPQLARYDSTLAARRRNADLLIEGIRDVPGVIVPRQLDGRGHVWHQFTVRITEASAVPRNEFVSRLAELGIGAGVYYPRLLLDYDAYREHPRVKQASTPVARRIAAEVLSLPVHPHLSESDVSVIIDAVSSIAQGR